MGPSKKHREDAMDLRRQQRARDAEAAEESRRRGEEAKRKAQEQAKRKAQEQAERNKGGQ